MRDCPYCRGTGTQYVESGSSLSYVCPDCDGTGYIPNCDTCGEPYVGEYCSNCYTECSVCGSVCSKESDDYTYYLCECCEDNEREARKYLHDQGISSHTVSELDLAEICCQAQMEAQNCVKSLDNFTTLDYRSRRFQNIKLLCMSEEYNCQPYDVVKCGVCGSYGIRVDQLDTEEDSDGVFENWRATCNSCGSHSCDMDDPQTAITELVRGESADLYVGEDCN